MLEFRGSLLSGPLLKITAGEPNAGDQRCAHRRQVERLAAELLKHHAAEGPADESGEARPDDGIQGHARGPEFIGDQPGEHADGCDIEDAKRHAVHRLDREDAVRRPRHPHQQEPDGEQQAGQQQERQFFIFFPMEAEVDEYWNFRQR